MNIRTLLRSSVLAIALCTASMSLAETQTTKTSGDLSDPSFWPNGSIPSDRALLSPTAPANYTITRNVTFAGIRQDVNDVTVDASAGNPTVTMTDPIRISKQRTTIFKGGIYDFGGTCRAFDTGTWSDNVFGSNIITLDACVFTNSTGFWLQNNSLAGCTYTLQNGAGLHVTERLGLTPLSVPASGLSLSVLSGSRVSCSKFQTDKDTGTAYEHEVVVSGAGSSLVTTGDASDNYSSFGYQRNGKRLLVADGASVDFTANANGFYLGTQGSSSNSVTVTGRGTTARFAKVLLGGWAASSGNKFLVLDGATATVTGTFSINGEHSNVRDGELVISNATLNVSKLRANSSYGSGTTVRIQGANPKVTMSGTGSNAGEFIKNTILVFDVPLGGYSTDGPIFSAPSGDIYGDGSATIVVNGLEANYRKLDQKTILWLMHGNQGAQFPASVLAAANAAMPAEVEGRCTLCEKRDLTASEQALFPSAHSRDLFLRIKPLFSTVLYIR